MQWKTNDKFRWKLLKAWIFLLKKIEFLIRGYIFMATVTSWNTDRSFEFLFERVQKRVKEKTVDVDVDVDVIDAAPGECKRDENGRACDGNGERICCVNHDEMMGGGWALDMRKFRGIIRFPAAHISLFSPPHLKMTVLLSTLLFDSNRLLPRALTCSIRLCLIALETSYRGLCVTK